MIYFFLKLVLQFVQFLELKFWTSITRREVGRPREASKHLNLELCYPKQCSHSIFSQKFLFKSNLRFPLRNGNGANCAICGETDNIIHALATCRKSSPVFNWVKHGLDLFCSDLTTEKILLLDIKINTPLPHNELPVIWFLSTALSKLWEQREAGRRCQLEEIKAYVIAKNNHVKHSKFNDMSIIIDQMISV